MKKCALCGGKLKRGRTSQIYEWNEKVVVIRGIPAYVCINCGEAYFSVRTAKRLEELIDEIKSLSPQTAVIEYFEKVKT